SRGSFLKVQRTVAVIPEMPVSPSVTAGSSADRFFQSGPAAVPASECGRFQYLPAVPAAYRGSGNHELLHTAPSLRAGRQSPCIPGSGRFAAWTAHPRQYSAVRGLPYPACHRGTEYVQSVWRRAVFRLQIRGRYARTVFSDPSHRTYGNE